MGVWVATNVDRELGVCFPNLPTLSSTPDLGVGGGLHQLMAVLWSGDGVDAVTEGSPVVRCYVDGNAH